MSSSPITSSQMDGETIETVIDFIFLGSKITADGDCSHEIKRFRHICELGNLEVIVEQRKDSFNDTLVMCGLGRNQMIMV